MPVLRFAEEILLLILHEESDGAEAPAETVWRPTLAGAVLMELAVEGRIDTDLDSLLVSDPTPLGDTLLDPALARIAKSRERRDAAYWVGNIAEDAENIRDAAIARMLGKGIMEIAADGAPVLARSVLRTRRYPPQEGAPEQEVRLRLMRVLFGNDIPEPRDVVLISLAAACGLFKRMLTKEEREQLGERIELVGKMDLIGRNVVESVRRSGSAPAAPPQPLSIPQVKGLPLLGSALEANKDATRFLVEKYIEHGPVFAISLRRRKAIVLAGAAANRLLENKGRVYLGNFEARDERAAAGIAGSGNPRYGRLLAAAYSRPRLEKHAQTAAEAARSAAAEWTPARALPALPALQRLAAAQLGAILIGATPPGECAADILDYLATLPAARMFGQRPPPLQARKRRRARRRIDAFCARMIEAHRPGGPLHEAGDLINDALDLHETDPGFMPETDLPSACAAPLLTGVDTLAAACACLLYALLKRPPLLARAIAEADAFFAAGPAAPRAADKLDTLRRAALETLRLYPPAPAAAYAAANSFDFAGCRIPAGAAVLTANAVTHFLPDFFPDPQRFDIDRCLPPREEHKQRRAYAPFGAGAQRCLEAGFAEVQIPLTTAAVLHAAELELDPPDYELKLQGAPAFRPAQSLRFKTIPRHAGDRQIVK